MDYHILWLHPQDDKIDQKLHVAYFHYGTWFSVRPGGKPHLKYKANKGSECE